MPHKALDKLIPDSERSWVDDLVGDDGRPDTCLQNVVDEALVTRRAALRAGALDHPACAADVRAGDATLAHVRTGEIAGSFACKRAADALRSYNTAGECAKPTGRRRGL